MIRLSCSPRETAPAASPTTPSRMLGRNRAARDSDRSPSLLRRSVTSGRHLAAPPTSLGTRAGRRAALGLARSGARPRRPPPARCTASDRPCERTEKRRGFGEEPLDLLVLLLNRAALGGHRGRHRRVHLGKAATGLLEHADQIVPGED